MDVLVRGTTPTILFKFKTVEVGNIAEAYLSIKQSYVPKIESNISNAEIDPNENSMSWILTQEQTLSLTTGRDAVIFCDWLLEDGTRGATIPKTLRVVPPGKEEVI